VEYFDVKQSGKNVWDLEVRKKPHYKAKREGKYKFKVIWPDGLIVPFDNGYRWTTSNGNIYEYTLKQ